MAYGTGSAAEYDFDRFLVHEKTQAKSAPVKNIRSGSEVRASRKRATGFYSAAPITACCPQAPGRTVSRIAVQRFLPFTVRDF